MAASTGWSWPTQEPTSGTEPASPTATASGNDQTQQPEPQPQPQPQPESEGGRTHTRMCWICHEEVEATYEDPGLLGGRRRRRYISEDGDRLINPCRCKGSVKYVHENCLKMWMNENPNAYECGRCSYRYRMERLTWAQRLRSPFIALALTITILCIAVFLLGFVADPLLGLWLDPVGTIADTVSLRGNTADEEPDEDDGWVEHFLKGIFSLGLLGFVKAFLAMSPWQWWNLRTSGVVGGGVRRGGTGRQRMENINLTLVLIGVATFLYTVWKVTRKWTERTLDRASQRILNVQEDTGDDSDDDDTEDDKDK